MPMRILLIEDDRRTVQYVLRGLREGGHQCDTVDDGRRALFLATQERYDVMVVDRMLPGLDGLSLVKTLRAAGVETPILFLTAVGGIDDRVEGLDAGGDDYLLKPFAFPELLARLSALSRRALLHQQATLLSVKDLTLDLVRRRVERAGELIELPPRQLDLLELLMRNEGRIVTRSMLLERVWGFDFDPKTSVVETHISRLRAKIDRPFSVPLLQTIRNVGYSLHAPE
jgi:two-component system, OmpR family, response regulator